MTLNTLSDLYVLQLRDLHDAEQQQIEALPKMADAASDPALARSFHDHLDKTRRHVRRLNHIFEQLGESPIGKSCVAMQGLIQESEDLMSQAGHFFGPDADSGMLDAGLIAHARRIEHYEIAGYGTVCTYAETLDRPDDLDLLDMTLDEEKAADDSLTLLARQFISVRRPLRDRVPFTSLSPNYLPPPFTVAP